jgi:hypothetical protein
MSRMVVCFPSRTLSILRVIVHFWSSASGPSIANTRTIRTLSESHAPVTFAIARLAPFQTLESSSDFAQFLSDCTGGCAGATEIADVSAWQRERRSDACAK